MKRVATLVAFVVLLGLTKTAHAETWHFTADWATVNQADSVWKTGFLTDDAGIFNQFPSYNETSMPGSRWDFNGDPDTVGCTNKNPAATAYENWNMYWEPGQTTIMPGYGAWVSARFVAPRASQYAIFAQWSNQRTDGTEVDVRLLRERGGEETVWDAVLWTDTLNGFVGRGVNNYADATGTHQSASYSTTVFLSAGEVLDFIAAPKANPAYSTTGIVATVTAIPEPSVLVLCASGVFGLLAYAWRRRR